MKTYLLMAGSNYYPEGGTSDWKGCFNSYEEAKARVTPVEHTRVITRGKHKGEVEVMFTTYKIGEYEYDWFDIEDLKAWIY
jgi:hypothetical protein